MNRRMESGETQPCWEGLGQLGGPLLGSVRDGSLLDSVLHGAVRCSAVWCGVVWCGVVWCGVTMSCVGALAGPFLLELMMVLMESQTSCTCS